MNNIKYLTIYLYNIIIEYILYTDVVIFVFFSFFCSFKEEQRLSASAEDDAGEYVCDSGGFLQAERRGERDDRIGAAALNRSRSINRQRLVAHSTAMESIQAESEPIDEEDDVP